MEDKMCRRIKRLPEALTEAWRITMLCSLIFFATAHACAQSPSGGTLPGAQPSPTPQASPTRTLEQRFFANILRDQRAIWTSPFALRRGDAKWFAPLALSTVALLATDRRSAGELAENGDHRTRLRISRELSRGGSLYATGGTAAAFYLIGRVTDNRRARETGLLAAEALIDSGIVVQTLKAVTQRPRPRVDDASGEFFDRGNSFPSGHAISAWSLAAVVANEYRHQRLVQVGAYGLAAAVSVSRYTGRNHFLSDVLVGSAIGYGIGHYVYKKNHDPTLDKTGSGTNSGKSHSRLLPLVSPRYSRAARAYGVRLAWEL
jgi:membrane-associated phospholipid phosphatase